MSEEFTAEEITALAEAFPPMRTARALLREAGFPMTAIPAAPDNAAGFWEQISETLANGVLADGRNQIMAAARRRFPAHAVFQAAADGRPAPSHDRAALRVLVVGAAPAGTGRIRPDRDAKAIEAARASSRLLVKYCPAASATDLQRVLDFRPDVLHLACHGDGGYLIFEDVHGEEHRVLAKDVADTLRLYRKLRQIHLRGLVLASCDGDGIAAQFTDVADRVVAHRGVLDDVCAVVFTQHLYEALAHTADVGEAARLAAQHSVLTDATCADVAAGLVVLPDDG